MKKLLLFIPFLAAAIVACGPNPETLAGENKNEIHSLLENAIKSVPESATAYEMAIPLHEAWSFFDSLATKAMDRFKDEDAKELYLLSMSTFSEDSLFVDQWKKVVEKTKSQFKHLPANTWLINKDTMSPSSIFKLNKACTKVFPYNAFNYLDFFVPTMDEVRFDESIDFTIFINYDPDTKLIELRTFDGRIGHFKVAGVKDLALGQYVNAHGDELYVGKNSKIKVEETRWFLAGTVQQLTIDNIEYAIWKVGYNDRSECVDGLLAKGYYNAVLERSFSSLSFDNDDQNELEKLVYKRKMKNKEYNNLFMFDIPEEEKNLDSMTD